MWALIEADLAERGVAVDRSGMTGTVCQTYPRAALNAWGWAKKGEADPGGPVSALSLSQSASRLHGILRQS